MAAPRPPGSPAGSRRGAVARTALGAAAVAAAMPVSLWSLAQDYRYGAVLGELALVPVCAVALALAAAHRHPWVVRLRAGRADWTVAATAFLLALCLVLWAPLATGNHAAVLRPDLLALPLVAVAAVCLLFGVRALVAFVAPLAVAFLAWPLPLRALLEPLADAVTALTAAAVQAVLEVLPLASVVPGPGDLRLAVAAPGGDFEVLVASACSGIAGIVGMLLVGLSAQYVLHGRVRARLLWLATAVVLAWSLNLARILLLLGVGRAFGEDLAMDVVHPVAGLLLLNLAMAGHVLLARDFGLHFSLRRRVPCDTPLTEPAPPAQQMQRRQLRRRGAALAAGVAVLAVAGAALPGAASAATAAAPVVPFADAPTVGPRFALADVEEKAWAQRYFGADSTWNRFRMRSAGTGGYTLWVDSVLTGDWSGLRAHPVLDCYRFHGFELVDVSRPTLAAGVIADQVVYRRPDGATWHVLSWEWPVRRTDGGLAHERVTLLASSERTDVGPGTGTGGDRGGLRGALSRRLAAHGTGTDPNPALAAALRADANSIVDAHLVGTEEVGA